MSHQNDNEPVIPLGIVLMTVGVILVLTAVGVYFVLPKAMAQMPARLQQATLPTAVPETENQVALLPETPLDETDVLVTVEEAAQPIMGQPERIVIPAINLDAPVSNIGLAQVNNNGERYYQWQVPSEFRAGWHNTSAPLGEAGNTVLNGHHNIHGEVFRDLVDLEEGAEIIVYDQQTPFTYTVSLVEILPERDQPLDVRIENAQWIAPTEDERLTLITCWPYEDNSHRVVVVAQPTNTNIGQINTKTTEGFSDASSSFGEDN